MKFTSGIFFLLFCGILTLKVHSQHPQYFLHNSEIGLPSDEVYSIAKDMQGFIWVGSDLGLYKFDGIRYRHYKSTTQKSKSVSGICFSASGKLYCYNFRSQIFYIEGDSLKELIHQLPKVINLTTDSAGNLWVSHNTGLASYNEATGKWKQYFKQNKGNVVKNEHLVTRLARSNHSGEVYFIGTGKLGVIKSGKRTTYTSSLLKNVLPGKFLLESDKKFLWVFSMEEDKVYRFNGNTTAEVKSSALLRVISKRKITNVRFLSDGCLWICTYKGIIRYNPDKDEAQLFYPHLSFSECLIDDENNYWFSTLQSGLVMVPDLDIVVWNKESSILKSDKLTAIAQDSEHVYFSTINGTIGRLNVVSNELNTFHTGNNADIQSLDYDVSSQSLLFNINTTLYNLHNGKITQRANKIPAIKSSGSAAGSFFKASSSGTYINDTLIYNGWSREVKQDVKQPVVWVAANEGLMRFINQNGKWSITDTLLKDIQTLSIEQNHASNELYVLTFDGKIYSVLHQNKIQLLFQLPDDVQPYKIKYYNNLILAATNKGLFAYTFEFKKWVPYKPLWGVIKESNKGIAVLNNAIWLATNNGLYKIPTSSLKAQKKPKLFIKQLEIDNTVVAANQKLRMNYGQLIAILPEAVAYSSNGSHNYAYRTKDKDTTWHYVPASVEKINLPALSPGNFEVELKVVDHMGNDAEDIIYITGYVNPPFWKNIWFGLSSGLLFIGVVYFVYRVQVKAQWRKSARINELNASKLTAIQSQMNPHFIFNSLNSIQDLILKGDVENSYSYLSTFSHLVRKTLNYSDKDFIDFEQEVKLTELYLSLEKLRFKKDLEYEILTNNTVDIMIPPLLIQPFIENALVHGLMHKQGNKKISIRFNLEDKLVCVIEDNGVGRERAKAIRMRQRAEHESFSGKAIHKRFDILSGIFKGEFGYVYEDLVRNNQPCGTRVTLHIPVKHKF